MFDDQVHDYFEPSDTAQSRSLLDDLVVASRQENQSAARRLSKIAELFELRRAERGENEEWAVDTGAAVGAEIAAALRISLGKAGSYMNYALAMHRLPAINAGSVRRRRHRHEYLPDAGLPHRPDHRPEQGR